MSADSFDLGSFKSVPLTVIATDVDGNVVSGATPSVTSGDTSVATIETAFDGTVSLVRASTSAGSVTISATVSNASGTTATGTLTVTLSDQGSTGAGEVTDVTIVAGVPA